MAAAPDCRIDLHGRWYRLAQLGEADVSLQCSRHGNQDAVSPHADRRSAGALKGTGSFAARRTVPVDELAISVDGVGNLGFPVPDEQASALCEVGRPAVYGRGEQTLYDPGVRDCWDIPPNRVRIGGPGWEQLLAKVTGQLAGDLGLAPGARFVPVLQSMLVYGPGQFFKPHQDSEKLDGMLASLVVMVPTAFRGGTLRVSHQGESVSFRGSQKDLCCVAFYADCHHEIRPVTDGHRIVLTYMLLLDDATMAAPTPQAATTAALAEQLRTHFTMPIPAPSWAPDRSEESPPDRLVYLLDHTYTARGVSWTHLKGSDTDRAAALQSAAAEAGCEVALALAEIQETWNCETDTWDGWGWRSRGQRGWYDDDFDDEPLDTDDPDAYELTDLVDSVISLDRWVGADGGPAQAVATTIDDAEVCESTPTVSLKPYASEFEGYMGNYGNTMDRWYRRAAVVVWPRDRDFEVHAEASAHWAATTLEQHLEAGDVDTARTDARRLELYWDSGVADTGPAPELFDQVLSIAERIDDADLAGMLLGPFPMEMLGPNHAELLARLVERYGDTWAHAVLAFGDRRRRSGLSGPDRTAWITQLADLTSALGSQDSDAADTAARILARASWDWLAAQVDQRLQVEPPSRRDDSLAQLVEPIGEFLSAAGLAEIHDLVADAIAVLCNDDHLLGCALKILRGPSVPGREELVAHCIDRLDHHVAQPERAVDDWSIATPPGCDCELCEKLTGFLAAPEERQLEWPIRKDKRQHIHHRIDAAELPVSHQTRRQGSPHTLVLTKTDELFTREVKARQAAETDLAWLRSTKQSC